jgi:exonuclease VII small subunit
MADVELDLLENAIDSLNEALAKYQDGKDDDEKAYKFCVQHLSHFLELILKYYVTQSHPLLIYKNPFAKSINGESQTIGLHEAINFLKNEGHDISDKFEKDIKWLKKLRNNIEHHKFSMDVAEVEETIGRLMSAVVEFDEAHENIDLSSRITVDQYDLFHELANTYEGRLKKAEQEVEEALSGLDPKEDNMSVYHCYECDHDTMIPNEDSGTGYKCTFCGNEESDDIEVDCGICGLQWPIWQMKSIDWADTGNYEYYCPYCLHDPEYRKDD